MGALGNTFSSLPHICAVLCPPAVGLVGKKTRVRGTGLRGLPDVISTKSAVSDESRHTALAEIHMLKRIHKASI